MSLFPPPFLFFFFSFFPALSQPDPDLRLRFVRAREFRPKANTAEGTVSRVSEVTKQQWGTGSWILKGTATRGNRTDEREIEVGGGGGRGTPRGAEGDVQEDAVVAED